MLLPHGRDQADNALKRWASPSVIAAAASGAERIVPSGCRKLGEAVRRDAASGALVRELEGIPAEGRVEAWRVS